jgi:hypothetical protein
VATHELQRAIDWELVISERVPVVRARVRSPVRLIGISGAGPGEAIPEAPV